MKFLFPLLYFALCIPGAYSQQVYGKGSIVADFQFTKILNSTASSSSLNQIKKELTIIDFFGTWCVPCVKALPHLSELHSDFKDKITIILVSTEEEDRLSKFINATQPFPFPVVADIENTFTGLFQPPSYPYTIVIDREGRIIAVTDAASLTKTSVSEWLVQKNEPGRPVSTTEIKPAAGTRVNAKPVNSLIKLSQEFIYAAKTGEEAGSLINALKEVSYDSLKNKLDTEDEKKAFWINLYNGYTQIILKRSPEKYESRNKFFKSRQIEVAGKMFSLDDIEHGILRHSKIKWSLGHLNKFFPAKTEKELRVKAVDYRIHFTLNCGAKSCPPIAFYNPENLDAQLDLATKAYLTSEANYDSVKNIVFLPTLMGWFRGDFGGKKGMKELLKKINVIPVSSNPKIKFKQYDWNLFLDHSKTDN